MEQLNIFIDWAKSLSFLSYFPRVGIADIGEIILITIIFYYIIKSVQGTRAWIILKGILMLLACYILAYIAQFTVIVSIFKTLFMFVGLAIVIIVQPDIRKIIERLGTKDLNMTLNSILSNIFRNRKWVSDANRISDNAITEIIRGCFLMSKAKTGALIVIEKDIPLNGYAESGISVNADITSQLLINIFEKNTPLHDGAVIIQNNKITAATCYLPLSDSKKINKDLGTRHRAGIGATEDTDSFVIIVSEETGAVSVAYNGKLVHNIDRDRLSTELKKIQKISDKSEIKVKKHLIGNNFKFKILSLISAFILWVMVITASNPVDKATFRDVKIDIINENAISDIGKTYEILGDNLVNVTIEDRKDIIDEINKQDIKVVADMSKLSYVNSVPLEVSITGNSVDSVILSEQSMQVSIEDIVTTEFDIEINTIGKVNENYYISGIELDTNTLIISGASSVINKIGAVKVDIDESQFTTDTVIELTPKIYDKNGELLDNNKFTVNNTSIKATVYLYNIKTVPLNVTIDIKNEAVKNIISSIDYPEKYITITGPDEALDSCESIDITIPLEIAITDVSTGQFIKNVSLQGYLSDGILATQNNSKINLIVEFKEFSTGQIQFTSSNIKVEGLGDNLEARLENNIFDVTYVTTAKDLDVMTYEMAIPYINLSNLGGGEHEVHIDFKRMDTNMFEDVTVKVTITEKQG